MANGNNVNTPGARLVATSQSGTVEYLIKDKKPWWHYDTVTLTAGAVPTEVRFFQIPKGQGGKDEIDTNVSQYGTLPAGWSLAIFSIRFAILEATLDDAKTILYNSVLALELGGTQQPFQAPTWIFTQGGGLYGTVATDGNASAVTLENWTNGLPAPQSVLRLPQPIEVKGGETFNVVMKIKAGKTLNNDTKIQVVLDCLAFEPVRGT